MTLFAYLALIGWAPVVFLIFTQFPHRQAAAIAVVGAWVLLPPYRIDIASLPDYSKSTAATVGVLLGTMILSPDRLLTFRLRWFDLPMLLYCLSCIPTSLYNGLGLYDGLSASLELTLMWGMPYLFGRLYFGSPQGLQIFTVTIVIAGLACVPFCVFEMRMSPKLLAMFYGGYVDAAIRLGGYRPKIFFATGIELGMWMTAASLAAWWLWRCGTIKSIRGIAFGSVLLPLLLITTIFCRSTGAISLLIFGVMLLWLSVRLQTRLLLSVLLIAGPAYVTVRSTQIWSGQQAVDLSKAIVGAERAQSLEYRFLCENLLLERAHQQPILGWGGWGRSDVEFAPGKHVPTDGLWIIILGHAGYVGLVLLYLSLIIPVFRFITRFPTQVWALPQLAAASLAAVLVSLYIVDCLLNAFVNIIYVTLAGGLAGLELTQLRSILGAHGASATGGFTHHKPASRQDVALIDAIRTIDQSHSEGRALKAQRRLEEAHSVWQQTLHLLDTLTKVHPRQPDLWHRWCDCANDLAWLELHHPELTHSDLPSVIALVHRTVEMYPDSAAYWNTLGTAYYRAGDNMAAVTALEHATALGGGTPFDDVFLAMAHARSGSRQQAEGLLAQAIARMQQHYPGHPELIRFCDEAQSILSESPQAPATIH